MGKRLCSEEITSTNDMKWYDGLDNSGFYWASKKLIAGRLMKSKEARKLLSECGLQITAPQKVIQDLQLFVNSFIYGDTIGEARAAKWRTQKKKRTIRLLPNSDSLQQHLIRANYLAFLLRHFHLKRHSSPIGQGWHVVDGLCLTARSTQPPLPLSSVHATTSKAKHKGQL